MIDSTSKRALIAIVLLPHLCSGVGSEVPSQRDLDRYAGQLSIGGGDPLTTAYFTNRHAVKELIIADQHATAVLKSLLLAETDWTSKASAIYILVQAGLERYVPRDTYDQLFADPCLELKTFAAIVTSRTKACGYSPEDPPLKWLEDREAAGDPLVSRIRDLLGTSPDFSGEEVDRHIEALMPLLTDQHTANFASSSGIGWERPAALIGAHGNGAVGRLWVAFQGSSDERIRARVLVALGAAKTMSAADRLREVLRDSSEYLRINALHAYAVCLGPDAIPELRFVAASDSSVKVRDWADSEIRWLTKETGPQSTDSTVVHPTPGERLEAEREKWLEQTRKDQAEWLQRIQDAREDAPQGEKSSQSLRPDAGASTRGASTDKTAHSLLLLATVLIGAGVIIVIGWRIYSSRRAVLLK